MRLLSTATLLAAAMLAGTSNGQSLKPSSADAQAPNRLMAKSPAMAARTANTQDQAASQTATLRSTSQPTWQRGTLRQAPLADTGLRGGGPANDECSGAIPLSLVPIADCGTASVAGDNSGATDSGPIDCDVSDDGFQDVWYSFNSGMHEAVRISVEMLTIEDLVLQVVEGCSGTVLDCDIATMLNLTVTPNTDYMVRVASNTDYGMGGTFNICVSYTPFVAPPANDECSGAANQNLAAGSSVTFTGTTAGATNTGDFVPGSELDGLDATVWHAFTTTECANVTVSYCGTDPAFESNWIFLAPSCPAGDDYILATSSDYTTCPDGNIVMTYASLPAGTYYLPVLFEVDEANGPYTIDVSASACAAGPANDGCAATADALDAGSSLTFTGATTGATNTGDFVPGSELDGEASTVWHAFTTAECANVTVSYCGTDPAFGNAWIFLAPSCPAGDDYILTSASNFTACPDGNISMIYMDLPAGTYYLPVMYDAADANGPYTIEVSAVACNTGYCIPVSSNGPSDGDFIANVTLETINNTTGGDQTYENYTAQSTMLAQSGAYTLSITSGDYGEDVFAAWIDYNQDSIFQETEKLGEFEGTLPGELITLPFTVPADANLGITRMRVRGAYDATAMDPCGHYAYAETEDYHVEITISTGVRELDGMHLQVFPNPAKDAITVSGAGLHGQVDIDLLDMTGRVVARYQQHMSAGQPTTLPLSATLAQGTYTLRLITANGTFSRPVMVK